VTQNPATGSGLSAITSTFTYTSPVAAQPNFEEVATATDYLGLVTAFAYDTRGDRIGVVADVGGSGHFNAQSSATYDSQGRLLTATNPLSMTTSFAYDSFGNLIKSVADYGADCLTIPAQHLVLPDHMHCRWTLPHGDADFRGRWRAFKLAFAKSLPRAQPRSAVMARRGEGGIWQRRYWEHTIRDDHDFAVHFDDIHANAVKPGFVGPPADWPHSTFRRCVAAGLYPAGWSGNRTEPQHTGERH
jgi:putative transposase